MHEQIVAILKKQTKPIDTIELAQLLNINKIDDNKMLLKALVELENDNIIGVTQQHRFLLFLIQKFIYEDLLVLIKKVLVL